jgi:phage gp37-like protein
MTSPVRQVEQAMLARLRAVPRGYSGLMLESYAAELDDDTFGWIRSLPAVWVTFGQVSETKRISTKSFRVSATFEVLCAQRALVENAGRLKPALAADVGVYELLEDNKLALTNQQLGLAIEPITPGPIRAVMKSMVNRDAVAVYAQEFKTHWFETIPLPGDVPLGDLVTVGFNYFLKPQHSAGVDPADKSDILTTRT